MSVTHLMVPGQNMGLVYCGGNGFTQSNRARPIFNAFNPSPNILLFDYPGYGLSGGEATTYEFDLATKLLGAHIENWQRQKHIDKILFWGKSFGGTICARLAGHYSGNNSLVLETTYNDLYSLVNSRAGLFKHLITVHIDPDATDFHINQSLLHYANPIAVIKSSNDPVTPPEESDKLVKLLREQGNNVVLLNMGAARHEELLFHPCKAAEIFKKLKPVSGSLKLDTTQCSAGK
jgi:hypothetical protein